MRHVSLLIKGVQVGSIVISHVSSTTATWSCLIMLLSIHLATNHAAVRAISMHSLNRQRANIVLSNMIDDKKVLTPEEVSIQERIFEWDGVLRWRGSKPFAKARIGVSVQSFLGSMSPAHKVTGAIRDEDLILQRIVKIFSGEEYLLWYDAHHKMASIVLKVQASSKAQLKAWGLGLWAAHRFQNEYPTGATTEKVMHLLKSTLTDLSSQWDDSIERIKAAGWDTDIASLETAPGTRIQLHVEVASTKSNTIQA